MRRFISLLVAIVLVMALVSMSAFAADVTYLDKTVKDGKVITEKKTVSSAISITASDTQWGKENQESWYVLDSDVTLTDRPTVIGTVNIILMNGKTLTAPMGITLGEGNTLTVFAQSDDESVMGKLVATSEDKSAAIGGVFGADGLDAVGANKRAKDGQNCGDFNWEGGSLKVTAMDATCIGGGTGGNGATGDGLLDEGGNGGQGGKGGTVTFLGGIADLNGLSGISAGNSGRSGSSAYAIRVTGADGAPGNEGGCLNIYAGKLTIHSSDGVCFGGGQGGHGGDLAQEPNGKKGGDGGAGGTLAINGGTISFQSDTGYCIGGGHGGPGGEGGARVGSAGHNGTPTKITINGNPSMLAGETEDTAVTVTGYNNEQFFKVEYSNAVSASSFIETQGTVIMALVIAAMPIAASVYCIKGKKEN